MMLFTLNQRCFGWDDVVEAAHHWAEWRSFHESVRQSLACQVAASRLNQAPSAATLKDASVRFRYAHHLISADDTYAWFTAWSVSSDELRSYLCGRLLEQKWSPQLEDVVEAFPIDDAAVERAAWAHAVCSGQLRSWAMRLAGHAALAAESASIALVDETPAALIAAIEAEFERYCRTIRSERRIAATISRNRLDWLRFDCRSISFANESAAREAGFCITEDGCTIDEAADRAGVAPQNWTLYADEIEPAVRPQLLAARPGDILGPLKLNGISLVRITNKTPPSSNDPQIRRRAEHSIVTTAVEAAMNDRVRWQGKVP